ncbi:MAG: aminopeptidase P family N-terminal domain-containing protein [Parasphingorhabdus sp.]
MPSLPPFVDDIERGQRINNLRVAMAGTGQDVVILTPSANMRYFLGQTFYERERFHGAIITSDRAIFICPKFEDTAVTARLAVPMEMAFWEEHENPYALVAAILADRGVKLCSLDTNCSYGHASQIFDVLTSLNQPVRYGSANSVISPLRT